MQQPGLTPPGHFFQRDCRPAGFQPPRGDTIKLLQWNIERGYMLAGIIEELKSIDADIIALQEVDVGCDRSGGADTGLAIAEALQLNYVFLCEFEELHSPLRDARTQGGGVHGNAILTKFDVVKVAAVPHRTHPVDWNSPTHKLAMKEPRRGERAVLRALVETPQGPLVVYNAHLEVFCGLLARIAQLSDIFADARRQADRGFHRQAILADMNTMAHGIARLSPNYCCDHMRFRSIGLDEATVWHCHVLPVIDPRYCWPPAAAAGQAAAGSSSSSSSAAGGGAAAAPAAGAATSAVAEAAAATAAGTAAAAPAVGAATSAVAEAAAATAAGTAAAAPAAGAAMSAVAEAAAAAAAGQPVVNQRLLDWGLSTDVAADATNPGFSDPFPPSTTTLDNPAYRWFGLSLMKGKLDWVLLRALRVAGQAVGNHDYELSDHKWLSADVAFQ